MGKRKLNRSKEELLEMQRIRQDRYYQKHKERLNIKAREQYWMWSKQCPNCEKPMPYTNKSNLEHSIQKNLTCKTCSHKLKPYEWIFKYFIKKCLTRNILVKLTFEDFLSFTKINKCTYCDAPLIWSKHQQWKNRQKCRYNLDRIDNTIGYSIKNCCVCCPDCNSIKSNRFSFDEMLKIGKIIKQIREDKKCVLK